MRAMTVVPNPRPRASLGRVLDDLGATLLDLVQGDAESAEEIGGVVIHDPVDLPVLPPHALVLGVGVDGPEALVALLKELGAARAAGWSCALRCGRPPRSGRPSTRPVSHCWG